MQNRIVDSQAFKDAVTNIYEIVDVDNSGLIDREELMIAICQLYFKLTRRFPGLTSSPSKDLIDRTLKDCDLDGSGKLSKEEFRKFAEKWFETQSGFFVVGIALSSVVIFALIPNGAAHVWQTVPRVQVVPKVVFQILVGMGFKIGACTIRDLMDDHKDEKSKEAIQHRAAAAAAVKVNLEKSKQKK